MCLEGCTLLAVGAGPGGGACGDTAGGSRGGRLQTGSAQVYKGQGQSTPALRLWAGGASRTAGRRQGRNPAPAQDPVSWAPLTWGHVLPASAQQRQKHIQIQTPRCMFYSCDSVSLPRHWGDTAHRFPSSYRSAYSGRPCPGRGCPDASPSRRGCCSAGRSAGCPRTAPGSGSASPAQST